MLSQQTRFLDLQVDELSDKGIGRGFRLIPGKINKNLALNDVIPFPDMQGRNHASFLVLNLLTATRHNNGAPRTDRRIDSHQRCPAQKNDKENYYNKKPL